MAIIIKRFSSLYSYKIDYVVDGDQRTKVRDGMRDKSAAVEAADSFIFDVCQSNEAKSELRFSVTILKNGTKVDSWNYNATVREQEPSKERKPNCWMYTCYWVVKKESDGSWDVYGGNNPDAGMLEDQKEAKKRAAELNRMYADEDFTFEVWYDVILNAIDENGENRGDEEYVEAYGPDRATAVRNAKSEFIERYEEKPILQKR